MRFREIALDQDSGAWLDWRSQGIGASDAPTIMGENSFKSREKLLQEKIHKFNEPANERMKEGKRLEKYARKRYEEVTGNKVTPICLEAIDYPWLRASLDGISDKRDVLVEIKCGKSSMKKAKNGEIPDYYFGQMQHQLMITGLKKLDYCCFRPEYGVIVLTMMRDESYINKLFKAEKEFYEEWMASLKLPQPKNSSDFTSFSSLGSSPNWLRGFVVSMVIVILLFSLMG